MKKSLIILTMAAAVLAALTGCQREMVGQENGKEGVDEVVTSFVFNVSTVANQTKQSAEDTQAGGAHFRGIVDTKLMSYNTPAKIADGGILITDKDADKVYDLSRFVDENSITNTQSRRILEMSLPLKTNALLLYGRAGYPSNYSLGTLTKEDKFGALAKVDGYKVTKEAGTTDFALRQRLEDADNYYTMEKLLAGILTVIMNTGLADANGDGKADAAISATQTEGTDNAYGFDLAATSYPAVKWSSYATTTTSPVECGSPAQGDPEDPGYKPAVPAHELYPLEERLKYVYNQMTNIQTDKGELRAAASEDILRIVKDLWSMVNSVRCAAPISEAEAVAKRLASLIHTHLLDYFSAASIPTDGSAVSSVTFKSLTGDTGIIAEITSDSAWPAESGDYKPSSSNLTTLLNASYAIDKFPFNFNMPRGVSYMAFNSEKKCFYYPQEFNTSAVTGNPLDPNDTNNPTTSVPYDATSYYYPAEILYFGNSPVRTSDKEHKVSDYPGTTLTGQWDDVSKWPAKDNDNKPDWDGEHVVSSTRSVAMKYSINYGVAMLETSVGYKTGLESLKDNNHAIQAANAGYASVAEYDAAGHTNDEPDKAIPITSTSFLLTGIIIGGQPVHVGWNFLPQKANSTDAIIKTGFIYDKAIANSTVPTPENGQNYTVVFDNYNATAAAASANQDKVFVALEFKNNTDTDFYGNCNLIRNGGYFYLIACLDPTLPTGDNAISWPRPTYDTTTDPATLKKEISHIVPPYKDDGTSEEITRVFVQDFVTKAKFTFGENSLKYAYLTVPDLRSSSVSIGLSVDIQWGHGLIYEDVILGGN